MPVAPEAQLAEKGCRKGLLDPTMNGGGSLPCEWNIPTEAAACCLLLLLLLWLLSLGSPAAWGGKDSQNT